MDKDNARQTVLSAELTIGFADTANTVAANVSQEIYIDLPVGARVVGGEVVVETAFDADTATIDIGDQILSVAGVWAAGDQNRYLDNGNLATAARIPLVPTGFKTTAPTRITPQITQTGNVSTDGQFYLRVEYVREGRGNELQT